MAQDGAGMREPALVRNEKHVGPIKEAGSPKTLRPHTLQSFLQLPDGNIAVGVMQFPSMEKGADMGFLPTPWVVEGGN